jgi:dihydropyrimidine dehydrogenase (NAD+) subunit PreA
MPASPHTLKTTVGTLSLDNPFILASGPPTASGDQIRHAFRLGWGGAVTKTIVPDSMEITDVSPRFAAWKGQDAGLLGFENIELLSKRDLACWTGEIAAIKKEYPDRTLIASIMASPDPAEWRDLAGAVAGAGGPAVEQKVYSPHRQTVPGGGGLGRCGLNERFLPPRHA